MNARADRRATSMRDTRERARSNVRIALLLGAVALGFFVLGMYLSSGGGGTG